MLSKTYHVILNECEESLISQFLRDPLTMPPFRDPHGMSIAHATCDHSLSALSNPPDFVAALCRDDTIVVDICINGQLLYYCLCISKQ